MRLFLLLLISFFFSTGVASEDLGMLETVRQRSFSYFIEQQNATTGLIYDRARHDGGVKIVPASIAATGFALTSYAIADEGLISSEDAYLRSEKIIETLSTLKTEKGFFYRYLDAETGERAWNSEVSSIDTALLIAGVLSTSQRWPDRPIAEKAKKIYEDIDWPWMIQGHVFSMGWTPEQGHMPWSWSDFSEHLILQILAQGSPTHSSAKAIWRGWERQPQRDFNNQTYLFHRSLFVYQFSHAWIDFRNQKIDDFDFWDNSRIATLAHREEFVHNLSKDHPHYQEMWGVTASDSENGYTDWNHSDKLINGTVVPCAAAGSLPFAPEQCLETLNQIWKNEKYRARYGFVQAFNPSTGWIAEDNIGINIGITYLMIENYKRGAVWSLMKDEPSLRRGIGRIMQMPAQEQENGK